MIRNNQFFSLLHVDTVQELLRVFPTRYESLKVTGIDETPLKGKRYVTYGICENVYNLKSRIPIIRFVLKINDNRKINCLLLNQSFYLNKLLNKDRKLFVLYYSEDRKVFIVHSIYDEDSYYVTSTIKPCYSLPKGISSSSFSNYIKRLLSDYTLKDQINSVIPLSLRNKYKLLDEFEAYKCVHLPKDEKDLLEGLRVFKYEEALSYSIRSLLLKKKAEERKKKEYLPINHKKINNFVKGLSFKLTKDQLVAIHDIVLDMEKEKVMYRLLQGDVSTGKTIVALTVLYANYLRKKQGAFIAPTYELARQHYNNAKKIFKNELNIAFLSGSSKDKDKILADLKDGKIDILISTHAVMSNNVKFKDLGLVIIDEQQLFGVKQREELLEKGKNTDLLMMSATPIPRTLSMIINADLDISTLSEFPTGTRDVSTKLIRSNDPLLYKAIDKALKAERQIFIVAPKIESTSSKCLSAKEVYDEIVKRYGENNCQLLHGRIKKEEQNEIFERFASGEKKILVSTTVIEVGIDVSRAALLIVYNANYFGLSSLHQLRGRIGRSGEYSLALLIYDGDDKDTLDKLNFLCQTNDGLKISEFDLKQRGTGSYSGTEQSGDSELKVCNFVNDLTMFQIAKKDALSILQNPQLEENKLYLSSLNYNDKINLS